MVGTVTAFFRKVSLNTYLHRKLEYICLNIQMRKHSGMRSQFSTDVKFIKKFSPRIEMLLKKHKIV